MAIHLRHRVCIELTSADPAGIMQRLAASDIEIINVVEKNELCYWLTINQRDYASAVRLASDTGAAVRMIKQIGIYWPLYTFFRRSAFLAAIVLIFILTLFLPNRVLFVQVENNHVIPDALLKETAKECGVTFGARRQVLRSEKIKNELLAALPELEWVGINTSGCVATIHVRERGEAVKSNETDHQVNSIVASRDGVIIASTVYQGYPLFENGDAVKQGQVLVSAYTDLGSHISATSAKAEITARTYRELMQIYPCTLSKRTVKNQTLKKYSLLIGKKLINLYKDSGICDITCVKIYKQNYINLPGGFQLPVAIITEECTYWDTSVSNQCDDHNWLQDSCVDYLKSQMISGQILEQDISYLLGEDTIITTGKYICQEMIGLLKNEENFIAYGEHDRQNREC